MNPRSARQPGEPPAITTAWGTVPLPGAWSRAWRNLFANRFAIYISVLLVASIAAYGYQIRTRTIFACQADGYSADRYVASCNALNFGDYEHGAFQYNLEPSVRDSVKNADVLFLGNSRLQVAFSTVPTGQWFSAKSGRYYLMGFSYWENALFEGELLGQIHPDASVYIINVDGFFQLTESIPEKTILHDPQARSAYEAKRLWQHVHQRVCGAVAALCGHRFEIFRSRDTGAYYNGDWGLEGGEAVPVSYDPVADQKVANASIAIAIDFLSRLTQKKCVILTIVPTVGTQIGTAEAIASGVGLPLVTPGIVEGLRTADGSHLDQPSAERWSQAFFQTAGPKIQSCLKNSGAAAREELSPTGGNASVQRAVTAVR
jgi:hypothetical protein